MRSSEKIGTRDGKVRLGRAPAEVARDQPHRTHRRVEPLAPVVEIARQHQRLVRRHLRGDELGDALHLPHPRRMAQPEVGDDRMQQPAAPAHRHVQQPALLEAVIRDVVVPDVAERPARQQRVAVLAVARHRVGPVGHGVAFRRQEIGLRLLRPAERGAGEAARLAVVEAAHLLQEDQVGIERLDAEPEVVDLQPPAGPDAAHALVDVVGRDTQTLAGLQRVREWAHAVEVS